MNRLLTMWLVFWEVVSLQQWTAGFQLLAAVFAATSGGVLLWRTLKKKGH